MGNTSSDTAFQSQFSAFLKRVEPHHLPKVETLFVQLGGSKDSLLTSEETTNFYKQLIDLIAPKYTETKRTALLEGWKLNEQLTYSDIESVIEKHFIREFSFKANTLKSHAPCGVKVTMPVLFQINTPVPSESVAKPPIAIVCVLDRSGSMSGSKLKFAIRSICKVIKHLSPNDIFHLVTYDDKIETPIINGDLSDKATLKKTVKAIRTGGSTNIGDALTKAASLFDDNVPTNFMRRIYLFSDGNPNCGEIITPTGLSDLSGRINKNYNANISTFGLGRDYNEEVMSGIAKKGCGEYYFIASAGDIPVTMSKAIHGLLSLFGTNATLTIRGRGNGILSKIYGKFANHNLADPIPIGDLHSNDRKKILVEIEISSGTEEENQCICECVLNFSKSDPSTTSTTSTPAPKITETITCTATVSFTKEEPILATLPQNNSVFIALTMQKVAIMDREIISLLDKNDFEGAIALKQKCLELLLDAEKHDSDNSLPKVIARVKEVLETLKSKKDRAAVRKLVDYEACREEDDDDHGYECFSDSDEGCYSDDMENSDPFDDDDDSDSDDIDDVLFSDDDY